MKQELEMKPTLKDSDVFCKVLSIHAKVENQDLNTYDNTSIKYSRKPLQTKSVCNCHVFVAVNENCSTARFQETCKTVVYNAFRK